MTSLAERRWPVPLILVGIAFVLILPGLLFSVVLLHEVAEAGREQSRAEAASTVSRVTDALDRELGNLIVAARVLASSTALQEGDLPGFEREALGVLGTIGQDVILLAPDGRQLVNPRVPLGAPLPVTNAGPALRRTVETRAPVVSDLFFGALRGRPRVAVMVPVLRAGEVVYVVSIHAQPSYFTDVLRSQSLPTGWIAAVMDGQDIELARNREAERFIGQRGPDAFVSRAARDRSLSNGVALDGIPILAAVARTRLASWRVGIGVPISQIEEPIWSSVEIMGLGGAITLVLGCVLAWELASSISRPLQLLALAGRQLGAGEEVAVVRSRIAEVDAVSRALVGASFDLRARDDALAAERARLAAIIETVPVGLLIAEAPSGRVVGGNRQLSRMLGATLAVPDPCGPTPFDADGVPVPPEQHPCNRALQGEDPAELRCRYRREDGSFFWVQAVAAPIRGTDGTVTGAAVALLDIDEVVRAREEEASWAERLEANVAARTAELEHANQLLREENSARSRAENQLRQAQKMEAVGQLTGGIAHDFNNMLTVIVGSLDLLRRRLADHRHTRLLDNALDGAHRAASLTARLLAFSRQQPPVLQPVDVNRLVAGMSELLRRSLGASIEVETRLGDAVWPALTDPNQLENALLNLAVNARDAILDASPGGGRLLIETANVHVDDGGDGLEPGDYVVISTSDTGTGMSEDVLSRVFEPFFTTKSVGQGTGLGLAQVHGFATQSGGNVVITSELGHGTTVRLYLPRMRDPAPAPVPSDSEGEGEACRTGETILLVEDEVGVRRLTGDALRELGYSVLEAEDAQTALGLLDEHQEASLLMTDIVMAGVGGRELAEEALRRRPDLRVLFTTGYTRQRGPTEGLDGADWELIGKPFTVAALGAKVREALAT